MDRNLKNKIKTNPKIVKEIIMEGLPLAFYVCLKESLEDLKFIVEYSFCDPNMVDKGNNNMLFYALKSGSLEKCKYLVEKVGLSPLDGNKFGLTIFEMARMLEFTEIEKYFEEVCGFSLDNSFRNPIRKGFFPDPSIVRVKNDYYMVNSSFTYFPAIPVSHSKDLINWKIIGFVVTELNSAALNGLESGRGYWAPDISYYKGKFCVTATLRLNDGDRPLRKQIIWESKRPEGKYERVAVIEEEGIDPSIFNDDDGRRYMVLNRGARIIELSKDLKKAISEPELIYYGVDKKTTEGPHILKKDGYYYLFLAEGGTGLNHRVNVARAKELRGKYEPCPYNPIMCQKDKNAYFQRCGHGKLVSTPDGRWFMVYLMGRSVFDKEKNVYTIVGRETAIDEVIWTKDGWPIVKNLNKPSLLQKKIFDFDGKKPLYRVSKKEDFLKVWTFPRGFEEDGLEIVDKKIILKSSPYDLSSIKARNICLRRQESLAFEVSVGLRLETIIEGNEAGLVSYYDENSYIKFAVCKGKEKERYLTLVEKIGEEEIKHSKIYIENKEKVELKMVVVGFERTFFIKEIDGKFYMCYKVKNASYLSDEGVKMGKRFTGSMVGIYGYGKEEYNIFYDFKYKDLKRGKK